MQEQKLQYDKGQEKSSRSYGDKEILSFLQNTHNAQGNKVIVRQKLRGIYGSYGKEN